MTPFSVWCERTCFSQSIKVVDLACYLFGFGWAIDIVYLISGEVL